MLRTSPAVVLALVAVAAAAPPSAASSTPWRKVEGAAVRLATTGAPAPDGTLRGVLEIALEPGWKTYWRDPGDSGVPPSIDLSGSSNVLSAELAFPTPGRHETAGSEWVGYDRPVAFPVTFRVAAPEKAASIAADVFLGICESICVPVRAHFALDPGADPDNVEDAALVEAAEAALPAPATPSSGVRIVDATPSRLVLEAASAGAPESAELFVAGEQGYVFGTPRREVAGGRARFTVDVLDRPPQIPSAGPGVPYTLATDAGAVSGFLPYM